MYRSRSLLVLFRKRTVLSVPRQAVRSDALKCQKFSKRCLSDSVKVLSQRDEDEEKYEKSTAVKSSKEKLFSFDDIFEEEGKVSADQEKKSAKNDAVLKNEHYNESISKKKLVDVLQDNGQEAELEKKNYGKNTSKKELENVFEENGQAVELSEEIDKTEGSKIEEKQNRLNVDQEYYEKAETKNEISNETVDEFEEADEDTSKKSERKTQSGHKRIQQDEYYMRREIKAVNLISDQNELFDVLVTYLNKNLTLASKNALIVCVLKKLEKLNVMELDAEIVKALEHHLDHQSQITRVSLADLLNILDFFMKGNREDNKLTFMLLHELCWRLRKSTLSSTLSILETVKQRLTTDKRREVNEMGKKRLLENIGNVASPQELLSVMYLLIGNQEAQMRVEEEASIMLQSMDSVQTYKLIYLLALNRSRNYSLVTNARKQLCSRPINLDMIKLKNLFFACEVLRIHDPSLLHEMSINMLDLLENDGSSDKTYICLSVLLSCSRIGWNFKNLTARIMTELCENIDSFTSEPKIPSQQLSSLAMSVGHLNLVEYGDFGLKIADNLISRKQVNQSNLLNVVYSMACIQKAEKGRILELLQPGFYQPLLDSMKGQPAFLEENVRRKLLSLYGYVKEDLQAAIPDTENIAGQWRDNLQEKMKSVPLVGLAKVVSEVLNEIAPLEKYTNTNIVTKYGYTVDFEIFVDEKLKAVRLDNTEGMQKVWIKMLDYSGFIQGSQEPEFTGETAMMLRRLKSEQDVVIVYVPYLEWSKHDKKVDHLVYLESKIKAAVKPDLETGAATSSDQSKGDN